MLRRSRTGKKPEQRREHQDQCRQRGNDSNPEQAPVTRPVTEEERHHQQRARDAEDRKPCGSHRSKLAQAQVGIRLSARTHSLQTPNCGRTMPSWPWTRLASSCCRAIGRHLRRLSPDVRTKPDPTPTPSLVKRPLQTVLLVLVATAGALLLAGTATAKEPCWKTLIDDWYDGRIDNVYPVPCYRAALEHMPEDVAQYSTLGDDINRALQAAIAAGGRTEEARVALRRALPPRAA